MLVYPFPLKKHDICEAFQILGGGGIFIRIRLFCTEGGGCIFEIVFSQVRPIEKQNILHLGDITKQIFRKKMIKEELVLKHCEKIITDITA